LPVRVLGRVFLGKFVAGLKRRFHLGQLTFAGSLQPLQQEKAFRSFLRPLFRQDWVVYAKPPFGGPHHVLGYLARYTHRVAITNHRLLAFQHDQVTFRWRDYAHGNKNRKMTLSAEEFLRRFLLHVLPRGFVRIRSFGFLANRSRIKGFSPYIFFGRCRPMGSLGFVGKTIGSWSPITLHYCCCIRGCGLGLGDGAY
jgi:hypothetical protein